MCPSPSPSISKQKNNPPPNPHLFIFDPPPQQKPNPSPVLPKGLNHLREKLIDMTELDVKRIFRKIEAW